MSKPRWRLYYGDFSTYSDLDGPPELAPALDVQAVVQVEANGRTIQHGGCPGPTRDGRHVVLSNKDYFCYDIDGDGFWTLTDAAGFFDYLMLPGWKTVKFGRAIEELRFREILGRAASDPDFTSRL